MNFPREAGDETENCTGSSFGQTKIPIVVSPGSIRYFELGTFRGFKPAPFFDGIPQLAHPLQAFQAWNNPDVAPHITRIQYRLPIRVEAMSTSQSRRAMPL